MPSDDHLRGVLVAVDDSPAALTAMGVAVSLASESGAILRAVAVAEDGVLAATLDELRPDDGAESRIAEAAQAVLGHIARLAAEQDVVVETAQLTGEPFRAILDEARRWNADLIVMGRSDRRGPASPYVGSEVEHVLEFCQTPVLVVPQTTSTDDAT